MEWKNAEDREGGTIKVPDRWLHLYYYEALNILFRFENALRLFVYVILRKNLGKEWDLAAISEGTTIRSETKKRIAQAQEHGYLGYEVTSPMLYLNSGELTQVISSDAYWKYFAPYFKAAKAIVVTKLQEIGTVRNSLAHFRPIKPEDIDLIKQNSRHLLLEVENCLVQITSITDLVPTNSEEHWYKEIKSIGNNNLSSTLYFSPDQEWVRLELTYNIPTLQKSIFSSKYVNFNVGNLQTIQLIKLFQNIRDTCIYVSEAPLYANFVKDLIICQKQISVVFSKKSIESSLQNIVTDLQNISIIVENETELIQQDNLARGKLIESKSAFAVLREHDNIQPYWQVNIDNLRTPVSDIDEVEYWGQRNNYAIDFISSTSQYPWMPSSVSSEEWPF